MVETYEQLPLTGAIDDHAECIEKLKGIKVLEQAIEAFYNTNKQYNPRQLHYLVCTESLDVHLNKLLGI